VGKVQGHAYVLYAGEGREEVVVLKDEPHPLTMLHQLLRREPLHLLPVDLDGPFLHRSETTHQGKEGGFSGSGGARHDDQLARGHFQVVVVQNLGPGLPLPKGVLEVLDLDQRFW
jgi:hypothetical protein